MGGLPRLTVRLVTAPDESVEVGTLLEREHRTYFEYASAWLERGLELSPFALKARAGLIEHVPRDFGPLPGLFDDSLPDGWGLLLMDRYFRKAGLEPRHISPLQRLAWIGTRGMGALTYHPAENQDDAEATRLDLHQLSVAADVVYSGSASEVFPQLMRAGGSPGGARPKVLVGYDAESEHLLSGEDDLPGGYEHWLVKFAGRGDSKDAGPIEMAYSMMALAAGLEMPPTRLFETPQGGRFFGVRRFDRSPGNRRIHVHTFGNLIESNFRIPSCDYSDLLKATSLLTLDRTQVLRAFRWMVFNVLSHNRDDHIKNFAYIFDPSTNSWSISPPYDLTFSHGPGGEHTMTVNGEGRRPGYEEMLTLAKRHDLSASEAQFIIEQVASAVSRWAEFADTTGVQRAARVEVQRHLNC